MPFSAQRLPQLFIIRFLVISLFLFLPLVPSPYTLSPISAVEYQKCLQGQTCTIGEFLYDDNYVPISSASCTLTSRDPSGNLFVDNQNLSGTPDGWYAYTINVSNETTGLYRGNICCTVDGEVLCLDKSFTINEAPSSLTAQDVENAVWDATTSAHTQTGSFGNLVQNLNPLTAADVWSYSNRNLTGFGTLIADMWSYSTRSLTSFGSLIANLWEHNNRTLTTTFNTTNLATKTDVTDIKTTIEGMAGTGLNYDDQTLLNKIATQVIENRDILDVLINAPIVQNFIEDDGQTPNLNAKLDKTRQVAGDLYAVTQQLTSRLGLISLKWDQLKANDRQSEIESLITLLGDTNTTNTVISNSNWVQNAWGGTMADTLVTSATSLKNQLESAKKNAAKSSTTVKASLDQATKAASNLETTIGDVSNTETDATLYGKLKEAEKLSANLETNDQALTQLLNTWNKTAAFQRSTRVKTVSSQVMAVNQLSAADSLVTQASQDSPKPELNQVLSLKAVNDINKLLLASMRDKPVKGLWLTEGSVVFRTLITNPSERISQKVPLKYYLPAEISKEDVITADEALNISFDPDHNALMVTGDFELEPGETRTFAIRVNDIWIVKEEDIKTLASQAEELLKPLNKTAFYGQGATLKSDIDVTLDTLAADLDDDRTPDARIRFYREAQIQLAGVRSKLDSLKVLVAQAGDSGSVLGAVNRTQGYIIGGIILVLLLGVAFLIYYIKLMRTTYAVSMNSLVQKANAATQKYLPLSLPVGRGKFKPAYAVTASPTKHSRTHPSPAQVRSARFFQILVVILSTTILTLSALNIRASTNKEVQPINPQSKSPAPENNTILGTQTSSDDKNPPLTLSASTESPLPILEKPYTGAAPLIWITHETGVSLGELENGFVHVTFTYDGVPVDGWLPLNSLPQ